MYTCKYSQVDLWEYLQVCQPVDPDHLQSQVTPDPGMNSKGMHQQILAYNIEGVDILGLI